MWYTCEIGQILSMPCAEQGETLEVPCARVVTCSRKCFCGTMHIRLAASFLIVFVIFRSVLSGRETATPSGQDQLWSYMKKELSNWLKIFIKDMKGQDKCPVNQS